MVKYKCQNPNWNGVWRVKKILKKLLISVIAMMGVVALLVLLIPRIENRSWTLFLAQQTQSPCFVVAYGKDYDKPDDEIFAFSKPIELDCEAKNGKLILTDKTNNKTYEGSYKIKLLRSGRMKIRIGYTVVVDGIEGTANISSGSLFMFIDGYNLTFESK